ncbi:hypothetical protein, partial [Staphylococcus haemolyticus]|uniref:hypothetical protein n=1 Tax=Staphylococcus haemolyticus TaxID=1283 RepID=UPI001C92CF41
ITEMITAIHIVKTQVLLPDPANLFHQHLSIPQQQQIQTLPYPIQSPITTQHPSNHFIPHSATIIPYPSTPPFPLPLHPPHPF